MYEQGAGCRDEMRTVANGTALVLKHTPAFLDRTWQSMDVVAQTSIEKALEVLSHRMF